MPRRAKPATPQRPKAVPPHVAEAIERHQTDVAERAMRAITVGDVADTHSGLQAAPDPSADDELIPMTKDGRVIRAHPDVVLHHQSNGWVMV